MAATATKNGKGKTTASKRTALILLAVATSVFCSVQSWADIMVRGAGTESCGSWLEARRTAGIPAVADTSWVLGYITAYTEASFGSQQKRGPNFTYDLAGGTDSNGIAAWIDKYCREHPAHTLYEASDAFIVDTVKTRQIVTPNNLNR